MAKKFVAPEGSPLWNIQGAIRRAIMDGVYNITDADEMQVLLDEMESLEKTDFGWLNWETLEAAVGDQAMSIDRDRFGERFE